MKVRLDLSYTQEELLNVDIIDRKVNKAEFEKVFKEELRDIIEGLVEDAMQSLYMEEELCERLEKRNVLNRRED